MARSPIYKTQAAKVLADLEELFGKAGVPKTDQLHTSDRVKYLAEKGLPKGQLDPI